MISFYEFKQIVENHPFDSIVKATNEIRQKNINNIFNDIVQAQSKIKDIRYEFSEIYKKADDLFAMKDDARAEDTGDYEELVVELNRLIRLLSNCDEQNSRIINLFKLAKFKR